MLLKFANETEWLAARAKDVTSTEVAALFGLNPWKSRLKLWQMKAGFLDDDFEESDPTKWGKRLQTEVGKGICEDEGWQPFDLTGVYSTFPELGLGSSYDLKAVSRELGAFPLEIKIADAFREEDGWTKEAAPMVYEFQVMNQIHCLRKDDPSIKHGAIGCLGRRQAVKLYRREYDPELGEMIDSEVKSFWESIAAGKPPPPDYAVDGELLERLRKPLRAGDVINLSENNRAVHLISVYDEIRKQKDAFMQDVKVLDKNIEAIKNEIHDIMGRNETAIIGDFQVRAKVQTNEERIQYETSFRRFDVSKRRKK